VEIKKLNSPKKFILDRQKYKIPAFALIINNLVDMLSDKNEDLAWYKEDKLLE
jgi:hypothetical protein